MSEIGYTASKLVEQTVDNGDGTGTARMARWPGAVGSCPGRGPHLIGGAVSDGSYVLNRGLRSQGVIQGLVRPALRRLVPDSGRATHAPIAPAVYGQGARESKWMLGVGGWSRSPRVRPLQVWRAGAGRTPRCVAADAGANPGWDAHRPPVPQPLMREPRPPRTSDQADQHTARDQWPWHQLPQNTLHQRPRVHPGKHSDSRRRRTAVSCVQAKPRAGRPGAAKTGKVTPG